MRNMRHLRKAFDLVESVRDLAYESTTYQWEVDPPATFYFDAEFADVRLTRSDSRQIFATVKLRAAFGWKLVTEQDDAGVYFVARRRAVIGNVGHARFFITLPTDVHVSLRLQHCNVSIEDFSGELELPSVAAG